jgi:hypothetical protein
VMEIGLFDDVKVVRISDQRQIEDLEFSEAQEAFCKALCRFHDSQHQQGAMEKMVECEVKLLNSFCRGENSPVMLKAWASYRRRLLFKHTRDS